MNVTVNPPWWAEALLHPFLRADVAETVTGDLLEEYRVTVYPARGRWRSDFWLARQVAGFLWRSAWVWGLLLGVSMTARMLFDTFAPPANLISGWGPRSAFTTYWMIALFVLAGAWSARRTGRARSGAFTAMAAHVVGFALGVPLRAVLFFSVIQPDPRKLDLFYMTGGWGEEWVLPLMLIPIVLILGTLGGLLGKFLGPTTRQPALT